VSERVLPDWIKCSHGPTCTRSVGSFGDGHEDATVTMLREGGWQVVDGGWTCPDHLPEDRQCLPGAMGRPRNPHCTTCGDTRGGPYGHEACECTYEAAEATG
jgi:hypothetical protein